MKAIGRLYEYFEFKHIKPTRFEKDFGLSNGYFGVQLKRDADIGSAILEIIINNCRDLNIEWLISGKGEMIKEVEINRAEEPPEVYKKTPPTCEQCKIKDDLILSLKREIKILEHFNSHLIEASKPEKNSPVEDGQKRKGSSSGYGHSKLSEVV